MSIFILCSALAAVVTVSYFIIKDANEQLGGELNINPDDDPTLSCWDDNHSHTEGDF